MSQGNDFANYASADADKTAGEDGLWYVAISSDDIKTMTLDQLDDAFRLGVITAETSVWTDGMEAWAPLREVAGLEDGAGDGSDDSLDNEETVSRGQSYSSHNGNGAPAVMVASSYVPAGSTSFQSPFGAVVESSQGASSLSPFGLSTAPMALNVDDDMAPMRSARNWHPERWGIGGVALLALAFVLYRNDVFASGPINDQPVLGASVTPQVTGLALNAAKHADHADPAADDDEGAAPKTAAPRTAASKEAADPDEVKADPVKAEADTNKVAAATPVPAPSAIKGSVADALRSSKKPAATTRQASLLKRKPAKKARSTGSKAKRASVSKTFGGSSKGGSAFDPLNDSLP